MAKVLNSHPDIFCVHAANTFWRVLGGADALDGIDYLRLIGSQGHAHRLAGDVHGISRTHIPALRREYPDTFNCAVVVREPLPRVRSQIAHLERMGAHVSFDESHAHLLSNRAGLERSKVSDALLRRLHAFNMLNAITEESAVGPIFRIEDLTQSTETVKRFVSLLSGDTVACPPEWLEKVVKTSKVNSHSREAFPDFSADDLALIRRVVTPESWGAYKELGYEAI